MINQKNYDFSFSGLKTAVYYYLKKQPKLSHQKKADVAVIGGALLDLWLR